MKLFLASVLTIAIAAASPKGCGKQQKAEPTCYKGKLEIKAICSNITISVQDGQKPDWAQASWTDEQTQKSYEQVFRLANPCQFPASIKEGDTFYFTIDTSKQENCAVCMAYYPTPQKAVSIKVLDGPCN